MTKNIISPEYKLFLNNFKKRVMAARNKAIFTINKELILLYHHIGKQILKSQANQGWGSKIINQLSKDLRSEFPEMKGFSPQNLKYMRNYAEEYTEEEIAKATFQFTIFTRES